MINQFDFKIKELENMKKYPKELYFIGNTQLLKRKKTLSQRGIQQAGLPIKMVLLN